MQVRNRGSSYAQVCTQFIQGNIPINPDLLCAWDEKIGIIDGYPGLSTPLSPAVDNRINLCKMRRLWFPSRTAMRYIPGYATSRRACSSRVLPSNMAIMGFNDRYRIPKDGWKINAVSARIGPRWVTIPSWGVRTTPHRRGGRSLYLHTSTAAAEKHVDRTLKSRPR